MVKKASEVNIMERVARPFTKTLTPAAWGMVIGTMFAVSLAMVLVEGADVGDGIDRVMRKLNADEAALSKAGVLPGSGEEDGEDPMDDDDNNREGGGCVTVQLMIYTTFYAREMGVGTSVNNFIN
eukprot:COSAG04_NODE_7281_length_1154_cov_1.185782_2_plen_125_part_00